MTLSHLSSAVSNCACIALALVCFSELFILYPVSVASCLSQVIHSGSSKTSQVLLLRALACLKKNPFSTPQHATEAKTKCSKGPGQDALS